MTTINAKRINATEFTLIDVKVNYPRLAKAHAPQFGEDRDGMQWSLQAVVDGEVAEALTSIGAQLKDLGDETFGLNLKAYVARQDGANDFRCYDAEMNLMTLEEREKIGMGSTARIRGHFWVNQHGTTSFRMKDVVITEMVEREAWDRTAHVAKVLGITTS